MHKGIIFDMDGVLADTEGYYTARRLEYLGRMGYSWQDDADFTGSNEKALWEIMVPHDPELRQELNWDTGPTANSTPSPSRNCWTRR